MGFLRFVEKYSIILFMTLLIGLALFFFGDFAGGMRSYWMLLSRGQWWNPLWWLFGDGQNAFLLTIFVFLIGYILKKLLYWEIRIQNRF